MKQSSLWLKIIVLLILTFGHACTASTTIATSTATDIPVTKTTTKTASPTAEPSRTPSPTVQKECAELITESIKDLIRERVDQGLNVGIVVGIVNPCGRDVFSYGKTALTGGEAVDENTVFEIGSIGKVFTAILLVEMVQLVFF